MPISNTTIGGNTFWQSPPFTYKIGQRGDLSGVRIDFLRTDNSIIHSIFTSFCPYLTSKLNFENGGGFKNGEIAVLQDTINHIPILGDGPIRVTILNGDVILGTVSNYSMDGNIIQFSIDGLYSRFKAIKQANDIYIQNATLYDIIIYCFNFMRDEIHTATGLYFYNPIDTTEGVLNANIKADTTTPLTSIDFVGKSFKDIFEALALLANGASFGVDGLGNPYFFDPTLGPLEVIFNDFGQNYGLKFNEDWSLILNRVTIYSKIQGRADDRALVGTFDDTQSQSAYGIKADEIDIPFYTAGVDASQPQFYSKFFKSEPVIKASFKTKNTAIARGRYRITYRLNSNEEKIVNNAKSVSSTAGGADIQFLQVGGASVTTNNLNFIYGRFALDFNFVNIITPIVVPIKADGVARVILTYSSTIPFNVFFNTQANEAVVTLPATARMTQSTIELVGTVTQLILVPTTNNGVITLDSLVGALEFCKTIEETYSNHTMSIIGGEVEVEVSIGATFVSLLEKIEKIGENARLVNGILTQ
jgi:hypothetical protein